jgi:hypothetical protein
LGWRPAHRIWQAILDSQSGERLGHAKAGHPFAHHRCSLRSSDNAESRPGNHFRDHRWSTRSTTAAIFSTIL